MDCDPIMHDPVKKTIQPVSDDIQALMQLEVDIGSLTNFEQFRQTAAIREFLVIYRRVSHRFAKDKNLQLKLKLIEPTLADYYTTAGAQAYTIYIKWGNQ